jgi:lipopolysaccharide transport system permease protein
VFFRDVRFVLPLLTQVWMYATPVIYPVELVPERLQPYYFLNPMAGLIDGYRRVMLTGQPPRQPALLVSAIVSLALVLIGYSVFKKTEPAFADLI